MMLEEAVIHYFKSTQEIVEPLCTFGDSPAIFYQQAPEDTDSGWKSKKQYPRLVYSIDLQANEERKSAGVMQITILCEETGLLPEELKPRIREPLRDLFLQADGMTYCMVWSKTEAFTVEDRVKKVHTKVIGMDLFYDILEFPCQEMTDPDPVAALQRYVKQWLPDCIRIGSEKQELFFKAGKQNPAFYFRVLELQKGRETNTVAWVECKMAVHVFVPDPATRLKWIVSFANHITLDGEVIMFDDSPMMVKNLQVNQQADYLTDGQIRMTLHYGLVRNQQRGHRITGTNIQLTD